MSRNGPNQWRDNVRPRKILYDVCKRNNLPLPESIYTVTNSSSTNLPFEITYGNNCKVRDVLPVQVFSLPVIDAIVDKALVKFEDTVQLDALSNVTITKYQWQPSGLLDSDSIKNPTSIIRSNTVFTIEVTDQHNCKNRDTVMVSMIDECTNDFIFIPTAFSPNRDGVNDCFGILSPPVLTDYKLVIFNRWSEKVFETNNKDECWDGIFKGEPAESDSYVYIVSFKCYNGTNLSKKGAVTILR